MFFFFLNKGAGLDANPRLEKKKHYVGQSEQQMAAAAIALYNGVSSAVTSGKLSPPSQRRTNDFKTEDELIR